MTSHISGKSGCREKKQQIVCYLSPDINARIYDISLQNGRSRQSMLAFAINSQLRAMGIVPLLDEWSRRVVRVPSRRRSVRRNASGRTGKMALAGWFKQDIIRAISRDISRRDVNFQMLAEAGVCHIIEQYSQTDMPPEHIDAVEPEETHIPPEEPTEELQVPEPAPVTPEREEAFPANLEAHIDEDEIPDF